MKTHSFQMRKRHSTIFQKSPKEEPDPLNENGSGINTARSMADDNSRHKASKELDRLARGSARVILDIRAVFPFNFFPDELIIDETKVSIHTNYFIYTKQVRSIEYKDIFNVIIQQGVFFAKLEIVDRYFSQESIVIEYLKKKDAIFARRIIQGLVIAKKENVDIRMLPMDELLRKLDRIGQTR